MTLLQCGTPPAKPVHSDRPSTSDVKRLRLQVTPEETGADNKRSKLKGLDTVGNMRPVESYVERTYVEEMAIVRFEHPDNHI